MKSLEHNKTTVLALILFVGVIMVYNFFLKPSADSIQKSIVTAGVGNDVVSLYKSLETATLDQGLFTSTSYRALVDFSVPIPSQPTGRTNPFDIIGQ